MHRCRRCDGLQYSVTNTYDASAATVLLLALYNPDAIGNDAQGWRIDGATRTTITAPALDDGQTALTTAAPENFLGAPAGVVVHRRVTSLDYDQEPSNVNAMLISYGSLAAAFVADSVGTITGWVVDTEVVDGRWHSKRRSAAHGEAPVAGATVRSGASRADAWGDDIKERDVQLAATAVTDADGSLTRRPPPASKGLCTKSYSTACTLNDLVAIVTRPWGDGTEEVLVVPDVPEPPSASAASDTHVAELVTSQNGLYSPTRASHCRWLGAHAPPTWTIRSAAAEQYDYRFEVDWSGGGDDDGGAADAGRGGRRRRHGRGAGGRTIRRALRVPAREPRRVHGAAGRVQEHGLPRLSHGRRRDPRPPTVITVDAPDGGMHAPSGDAARG